jgi:hypothetical protein
MELCSDDHVEICYESRECPLCNLMFENAEAQQVTDETCVELEEKESKIREQYNELYEYVKSIYPECLV